MDLLDMGPVGELEFVRRALAYAGRRGLSIKEISELTHKSVSAVSNSLVIQLTWYCGIYEEQRKNQLYMVLDPDIDGRIEATGSRRFMITGFTGGHDGRDEA